MLLKSVLGFVYWILVTLPLQTIRTTTLLVLSVGILGVTSLYLSEQHNYKALNMAATTQYNSNGNEGRKEGKD
jgi:hypothetical protein